MKVLIGIKLIDYINYKETIFQDDILEFDNNTKVKDIRKIYGIPKKYYCFYLDNFNVDKREITCENKFPYMIENEKIKWNCDINSSKIVDLVKTLEQDNVNLKLRVIYTSGNVRRPILYMGNNLELVN